MTRINMNGVLFESDTLPLRDSYAKAEMCLYICVRGPVREKPRARGPGVFSLTPRRERLAEANLA